MSLAEIAATIDPDQARRTVALIMTILGAEADWDSDTCDAVTQVMTRHTARPGLPSIFDQDEAAIKFWKAVQW